MSTIHGRQARADEERGDADDPFRYGWRYVKRVRPDGSEELEQVPLTLEDVLHPEEGDFHVLSDAHDEDCNYLKSVLKAHLAGDPEIVVLSDCRVVWGVPGLKAHGPDLVVFRGLRRRRDWRTFDAGKEKSRPLLVVEVTSPDTRVNDVVVKVEHYHRAGVPLYVIADAREVKGERRVKLIGYKHAPAAYEPYPPDARGRIWLEPVGLWLGVEEARLVLYDGATGERIGDYTEVSRARAEAEQRARVEAARAEAEARVRAELEERIRRLEEENRRLLGGAGT